jgi:hypothetical protein
MAYVLFWRKLLFLVFFLRQSDADSDQCCGLHNEISRLEGHVLKIHILTEVECRNETQVSKCYVTGLQCDTVKCSQMSLSGSYIVHVL